MKNIFIKNRNGKKISVDFHADPKNKRLAIIMHGLGGFKDQKHIQMFAETFRKNGFNFVKFDTRNTIGESEGKYEIANVTNYYNDLEDVIRWVKKQDWYSGPFHLVGHSLGGICVLLYAENHPGDIKALAPISTVVSGKLWLEHIPKDKLKEYNKTGYRSKVSASKPGTLLKLKWTQFQKDLMRYDTLKNIKNITMPTILIVGKDDDSTPVYQHKILFSRLKCDKELHVIEDATHTFKKPKELLSVNRVLDRWIKRTSR